MRIRKTKSKVEKAIYDILRELVIEIFDRVDKAYEQFEKYGVHGETLQMIYMAKRLMWVVSELMAKYKIADKKFDEVHKKLHELYEDLRELKEVSEELLSKCF